MEEGLLSQMSKANEIGLEALTAQRLHSRPRSRYAPSKAAWPLRPSCGQLPGAGAAWPLRPACGQLPGAGSQPWRCPTPVGAEVPRLPFHPRLSSPGLPAAGVAAGKGTPYSPASARRAQLAEAQRACSSRKTAATGTSEPQ
ncbi:uncharacterized protein LOC115893230 [Rhinopithecus roxellana]|uniref:uncharacterized protein LOC115893230 n=1 Tax=Rhinopithecus roxellana TaxID=61622 RepID=UPI0012371F38|nr:uncharacterized protein LOC115893230 [Rhinopithecus roxellana]